MAFQNRGKKLVSLALQNDCASFTPDSKAVSVMSFSTMHNHEEENLIQLEDLENFDEETMPHYNAPIPRSYLCEEDSNIIENSQDMLSYTELLCPPKRMKITSMESRENYLKKPAVFINESPSKTDSEADTTNYDFIDDFQHNGTKSPNPDTTTNQCHNNRTATNEPPYNPDIISRQIPERLQTQQTAKKGTKTVKFPHLSQEERVTKSRDKHPMLPDNCGLKCRRQCHHFNIEKRTDIWKSYWDLTHDNQIRWLARYIHLESVKAPRNNDDGQVFKKYETRNFFLPWSDGTSNQVCKKMFLNTFRYKNDSIVTTISKKLKDDTTKSLSDKRGTHEKLKVNCTIIESFINMYKPCTAHYRRHNAPNVKYLAQDVTIEQLYKDFKNLHPDFKCCKEIIRRTLKSMNISLHRPQNDKCYDCLFFETSIAESLKAKKVPELKQLCQIIIHKKKASEATNSYNYDATREKTSEERIYSMDLQKSVLLPMMPTVKDCFFTNRMISFNLTFCGLPKNSIEGSKCLVWHEATGGRDGKDIVDAIVKFILSERDVKHFTFWADNCCAQNKNWILYTALVTLLNSHDHVDSITLKYLTKGHTHMSADGVHGNIEKNFRKVQNIYDYEDYKECLITSRKQNVVIEVLSQEKRAWEKKKKTKTDTIMLKDIVEVKFTKGQRSILYKKTFGESYTELDFLQKRFKSSQLPKNITKVRGIRSSKKKEIIDKLVNVMPSNRRLFWEALPENDCSIDLISQVQEEACF